MRRAWLLALAMAVTGCGRPPGTATTPSPYALQALTRRWLATDVHQYDVTLQAWNGSSFAPLDPPVTVVLPPGGRAVFTNLRQGRKYRAVLVARGNPGGTAPDEVLNADHPTTRLIDLTAAQDVPDRVAVTFDVELDAVPFSGRATVEPQGLPPGTTDLEARLEDPATGEVLSRVAYPVGRQAAFTRLRAGVPYRVTLVARADGETLATATGADFAWDADAPEIDDDLAIAVAFE